VSDFDLYDLVLSLLSGLAAAGALLLYAPLWSAMIIMPIGVTISLFRHLDLTPAKRQRAAAEFRSHAAAQTRQSGHPTA